MLEALLGQIKGVFGKTFVFAGLLPAAVLYIGWKLFRGGDSQLQTTVAGLLKSEAWSWTASVLFGIKLFLLGLLFFAIRAVVLNLLQSVPGRILSSTRRRLVRRQMKKQLEATRRSEDLAWKVTVLRWHELGYEQPVYLPEWIHSPTGTEGILEALKRSQSARDEILKVSSSSDEPLLTNRQTKRITKSLCDLYALAFSDHTDSTWREEAKQWAELLKRPRCKKLMQSVINATNREWVYARAGHHLFPREEWMAPTALGNRFAALDDYAEKRYGIDTTTLWRRLWGVLTSTDKREISDAQLVIEVYANLAVSFCFLCLLVISTFFWQSIWQIGFEYIHARRVFLFVATSVALAGASYMGAINASDGLSEKVIRLVDLYRLQVIRSMGLKIPSTVAEERRLFEDLQQLFTEGKAMPGALSIKDYGDSSLDIKLE